MPTIDVTHGVELSYETDGRGPLVLLLHGFASSGYINWIRPGIVDALDTAGYRTLVPDQRGHGASTAPREVDAYAGDVFVRDAQALLDATGAEACHVVGYSMGAWVGAGLAVADPRVRSLVLGGIGARSLERDPTADRDEVVRSLEADDKGSVNHPVGRSFRDFADLTGADRLALAALLRAGLPRADLGSVGVPTLVLCGDDDPLAGDPAPVAARIADARSAVVGGSHLNVINNRDFHRELLSFLDGVAEEEDR